MCGEAENLSVYRVGKSLTSIWVFLYPKVDFIKNFLYNIYIRKIYAGIAQLARAADLSIKLSEKKYGINF